MLTDRGCLSAIYRGAGAGDSDPRAGEALNLSVLTLLIKITGFYLHFENRLFTFSSSVSSLSASLVTASTFNYMKALFNCAEVKEKQWCI